MSLDLNQGWSYWDVIDEPVDELRRRYAIQRESAFLSAASRGAG